MSDFQNDGIDKLLRKHGLHESCFDFGEHVARFTKEMDLGLSGLPSSLFMLPTYLDICKGENMSGEVLAIDAGGTNLRVGLVEFQEDKPPEIKYYNKQPVPGAGTPIDKDDFFDTIAESLAPITEHSDKVGFSFSFPTDVEPSRDGRIIYFDKEVKVNGGAGAMVGEELNVALKRLGKSVVNLTLLNDSTAALLGVAAEEGSKAYSGHIGLIYGTGINICYSEDIDRIGKLKAEDIPCGAKHMLINTETGSYAGFDRGSCDVAIDNASDDPGSQLFEKMVSGAYFSVVVLYALKLAADEGFFTDKTYAWIKGQDRLDPIAIDDFMREPCSNSQMAQNCSGGNDRESIFFIIDSLYDRAAKLVAIAVTAVMIRCGGGTEEAPILLVVDGSTFHKGYKFRERFEGMIMKYSGLPIHYRLVGSEDHTLIGAAASVFM